MAGKALEAGLVRGWEVLCLQDQACWDPTEGRK